MVRFGPWHLSLPQEAIGTGPPGLGALGCSAIMPCLKPIVTFCSACSTITVLPRFCGGTECREECVCRACLCGLSLWAKRRSVAIDPVYPMGRIFGGSRDRISTRDG